MNKLSSVTMEQARAFSFKFMRQMMHLNLIMWNVNLVYTWKLLVAKSFHQIIGDLLLYDDKSMADLSQHYP